MRAALADYGEISAGAETTHDCARLIPWPESSVGQERPLFCPIDRHGTPQTSRPLSVRTITAILAHRLRGQTEPEDWPDAQADQDLVASPAGGHRWQVEDRQRAAARFAEIEATLDEIEKEADAIMARVHAAMDDELRVDRRAASKWSLGEQSRRSQRSSRRPECDGPH